MNPQNSSPEKLVHARHRAAQMVVPLGALAAGLAGTLALLWYAHPAVAPVEHWQHLRNAWIAGLAATLTGATALWYARRRPLLHSAAETDALLATHNRLETAMALRSAAGPMARAQRAETEQFLQQSQINPRWRQLTALSVLVALLAFAHVATLVCWARSPGPDLAAKANSTAADTKTAKTEPAAPTATIEWNTPESETSATAIEEVPLEAEADSSTGLREAVLKIEVNGEQRLAQPLTDDLTKAGRHLLKPSLYLDQLDVKTYDIVSYHIDAKRTAPGDLPPTISPVQFVEIKPMRDDTFICAGGDQPSKCFNYVTALKAAQLRLMKDNFTLAHAEVGHENDEWQQENTRVADTQNRLAGRTDEVIDLLVSNHYPEQVLTLVRQSQPLMTDASGEIQKEQNQPALAPQGKALGYLTEVEKYLKNSIKLAGSSTQPKAADPFQRPKNLDLKTHPLTRAGKIDKLADAQTRLAGDLARGETNSTSGAATVEAEPGAEEITGAPGERQDEIKRRIDNFLGDPGFNPDALKHLQSSDDLSGKSQEQIARQDFSAASEPAAAAALELRQTAAALRADGNQAAKNKLADALLQLSAAAGNVRKAAQAKSDEEAAAALKKSSDAVDEATKQLAREAQRQQDNGSTNAAARLDDMSKLLQSESLKQMFAQAHQTPRDAAQSEALAQKLDALASRAGQMSNPNPLTRPELARLVERLQRTQANLNNLASQCTSPGSSQSGSSQSAAAQTGAPKPGSSKPGASGSGAGNQPSSASTSANGSGGGQSYSWGDAPVSELTHGPVPKGGSPTVNPGDLVVHARSQELTRAEMQQAEAAQLLDDLRLGAMDSRSVADKTQNLAKLDEVLREAAKLPVENPQDFVPLAAEINPPLTGLIQLLQTELAATRRPYELTSKEAASAPPAYRVAVADYFEQVSHDYQPAADSAGKNR